MGGKKKLSLRSDDSGSNYCPNSPVFPWKKGLGYSPTLWQKISDWRYFWSHAYVFIILKHKVGFTWEPNKQ